MSLKIKRIAVSGAAGQIAYSLIFKLAAGELFGKDQPIALHLLEVPQALDSLKGVVMELEDCAFPMLTEIHSGSDPEIVFKGVDTVFLIGSKPRGPGMERKDLLQENGPIFIGQGKALGKVASPGAIVLVVGNPCNTNCLIAEKYATGCRLFSMTRLDQNRAVSMLATRAGAHVTDVNHVTIWGNHSTTQVPDFLNAQIKGHPVVEVIQDRKWLEETFIPDIQKRGAVVIKARGKSSAASAAIAAFDAMHSLITPTPSGEWFSMGVKSDGNPYGIAPGLFFSFPCISKGQGELEIVKNLKWDDFLKRNIHISEKELLEERSLVNL